MNHGDVAILNCSDGDTRITFNTRNKGDIERTRSIVTDMLRRGYCIVVDLGEGQFERVMAFDPATSEYLVRDAAPVELADEGAPPESVKTDPPAKGRRGAYRRVSAKAGKSYAVGPTAGGGLGVRAFGPVLTREAPTVMGRQA